MGVADGPRFAPSEEGAESSITADPCRCLECLPGPGIVPKTSLMDVFDQAGIDPVRIRYCSECRAQVHAVSVEEVDHWVHICIPKTHTWTTHI